MDYALLGINAAVRGLASAQTSLNTMGQNVANANTEGYSRQRVAVSTAGVIATPGFNTPVRITSLGNGTHVDGINRMRNDFLDTQIRRESAVLGANEALAEAVTLIEDVFHEPSETGLASLMDQFFNSWHTLNSNPESPAVRAVVRDQSAALANAFNDAANRLITQRGELDAQIKNDLVDVNNFTRMIADLNMQIAEATYAGGSPNHLLDQRNLALEKLSKIVKIETVEHGDGKVWVSMQGRVLVAGHLQTELTVRPNAEGPYSEILFEGNVVPPEHIGGRIGALVHLRDEVIGRERYRPAAPALEDTPNGILHRLDTLANQLAQEVNALHRNGSRTDGVLNGIPFFVNRVDPLQATMGAASIEVNPVIMNGLAGLQEIAAGSNPPTGPGDSSTANAIAALRSRPTMGGTATFGEDYRNFVSSLGVMGQSSQRIAKNQGEVLHHLFERQQETSGVNMDEEMADMVRYQHAYQASARVLNTFDEILDRIINGLGAGR